MKSWPYASQPSSSRRAMALILALVALVITSAVTVALTRLAVLDRTSRALDDAQRLADDLLHASDAPIRHWLQHESPSIVLPADVELPAVEVLHDRWMDGNRIVEVRITAFDQLGMAPLESLATGSLLRLAVPAEVTRFIDAYKDEDQDWTGLDEVELEDQEQTVVYPTLPRTNGIWLGGNRRAEDQPVNKQVLRQAIGAWIPTHNPGAMNIHTAPMPLIEQALREAGRGGLELIVAARESGGPVALGDISSIADESPQALRLVGASVSWALRIDLSVGPLRRSWWAVYQRQSGRSGGWECVQRHVITE